MDIEPGVAYDFSAITLRGAAGNSTTNRRRRGYTVRHCADEVRYNPPIGTSLPIAVESLNRGDLFDSDQCSLAYPDG